MRQFFPYANIRISKKSSLLNFKLINLTLIFNLNSQLVHIFYDMWPNIRIRKKKCVFLHIPRSLHLIWIWDKGLWSLSKIIRSITYRDAPVPVVTGELGPSPTGTQLISQGWGWYIWQLCTGSNNWTPDGLGTHEYPVRLGPSYWHWCIPTCSARRSLRIGFLNIGLKLCKK